MCISSFQNAHFNVTNKPTAARVLVNELYIFLYFSYSCVLCVSLDHAIEKTETSSLRQYGSSEYSLFVWPLHPNLDYHGVQGLSKSRDDPEITFFKPL